MPDDRLLREVLLYIPNPRNRTLTNTPPCKLFWAVYNEIKQNSPKRDVSLLLRIAEVWTLSMVLFSEEDREMSIDEIRQYYQNSWKRLKGFLEECLNTESNVKDDSETLLKIHGLEEADSDV